MPDVAGAHDSIENSESKCRPKTRYLKTNAVFQVCRQVLKNSFRITLSQFYSINTIGATKMKKKRKTLTESEKQELTRRLVKGRMNNFKKYGKVGGPGKGSTGRPPFGYYWHNGILKIDPEKSRWVRSIFELRESGLSYKKIAYWLNDQAVLTNRGKQWSKQGVRNILLNRFYFGEVEYGGVVITGNHQIIF